MIRLFSIARSGAANWRSGSNSWGTSENNRRARFYSITRTGRKQLAAEALSWARTVAMVNRMLENES